jgi:hypothetical protein
MEAASFSETMVSYRNITRHHNPEDVGLNENTQVSPGKIPSRSLKENIYKVSTCNLRFITLRKGKHYKNNR